MYAVGAVLVAFLFPLLLVSRGVGRRKAWLVASAVVPVFVLFAEFVLPYSGGGASLWPIAFVVGGLTGAAASGAGTLLTYLLKPGRRHDALTIPSSGRPKGRFAAFAPPSCRTLAMPKAKLALLALALASAAYGLPSAVGAIFVEDVAPEFRAASFVVGALLVAGAALLIWRPRWGVGLLWLSAGAYAALMLIPALSRHGSGVFAALMGAFYASLAIRVGLAAAAHALVWRRHG